VSQGSSTPSAEPGTSSGPESRPRKGGRGPAFRFLPSAYRRLPIRWRLAAGSSVLTFAILAVFAVGVGTLTVRQIRTDFHQRVRDTANELQRQLQVRAAANGSRVQCGPVDLNDFGAPDDAVIRVLTLSGDVMCHTDGAPDLGFPRKGPSNEDGYRVESRHVPVFSFGAPLLQGEAVLQYGQPRESSDETIAKVRFFLLFGVLGGTGLALLAGLFVARRAIAPIAELTWTAREIERTGDPSLRVPLPEADDEVAVLARTLDGMLASLDAARSETELALERQRAFVADASHELRTPLTSVLANLELLAEQLEGEQAEAAGSALRSSQRMRRLVADLLLLARHDAGRRADHVPLDVGAILVEAAAELEPVSREHLLEVDARPVMVDGARDELHRLTANLLENSLRHTPAGTSVRASVTEDEGWARIVVEDDGPGVPPDVAPRIFERFVRGGGDRAGSSGLGLAIVRSVAVAHGGRVALEQPQPGHGTRFVVTLPLSSVPAPGRERAPAAV
jgi:two-component system OmpR family sensor kinase